jgi:hypothetical protein
MSFDVNLNTCRYNPSPFVPLTPDVTRVNLAGTLRGRLNDDNEWFAEVFVSNAKTIISEQASPYSAAFLATDPLFQKLGINPVIVINPSSPYYPSDYIAASNHPEVLTSCAGGPCPVSVSYRALDGGGRIHTDKSTLYHLATGFTGSLKGWDYDAAYSRNESQVSESTQRGYQNQTQLVQLLSGNDAFNPFVAHQSPDLAAQILATNYNGNIIKSTLTTDAIDLKVQHELAKLPGGALAFAAGVVFRKEALDLRPSAAYQSGDVSGYGAAVLPFSASRNSHSIYGEVDAPILKSLEADLSLRNDHYPNASSTNPKFSLKFLPIDQVAFRGSIGTGFREPSLPELFTPLAPATTAIFVDPVTGAPGQFNQQVGGNPNLVPEKSKQFSLGAIVEPIKGLSASADYYHVRVDHAIIALDAQTVVNLAAAGNPVYVPLVSRDSSGNITNIITSNVNSGGVVTAGVDVDVKWTGRHVDPEIRLDDDRRHGPAQRRANHRSDGLRHQRGHQRRHDLPLEARADGELARRRLGPGADAELPVGLSGRAALHRRLRSVRLHGAGCAAGRLQHGSQGLVLRDVRPAGRVQRREEPEPAAGPEERLQPPASKGHDQRHVLPDGLRPDLLRPARPLRLRLGDLQVLTAKVDREGPLDLEGAALTRPPPFFAPRGTRNSRSCPHFRRRT